MSSYAKQGDLGASDIAEGLVIATDNTSYTLNHSNEHMSNPNDYLMRPQVEDGDSMPNPIGIGTVPIAKTDDSELQCYIKGCKNVGNSVC